MLHDKVRRTVAAQNWWLQKPKKKRSRRRLLVGAAGFMVVDPLSGQTSNPYRYARPKASVLCPRRAKNAKDEGRMCGRVSMAGPCRVLKLGSRNRSRAGAGTGLMKTDGTTQSDGTAALSLHDSRG